MTKELQRANVNFSEKKLHFQLDTSISKVFLGRYKPRVSQVCLDLMGSYKLDHTTKLLLSYAE